MSAHTGQPHAARPRRFRVTVEGGIDPSWSGWFEGMEITSHGGTTGRPITVLTGAVPDQVALRGLLNRLWDLNLVVLSMQSIEPHPCASVE